jgi:hypothetical protein
MVDEGVCAIFQDEETSNEGSHVEEDIAGVHHCRLLCPDSQLMANDLLLSQELDSDVKAVSPGADVVVFSN